MDESPKPHTALGKEKISLDEVLASKYAVMIKKYTNVDTVEDAIKVLKTKQLLPYILVILDAVASGQAVNEYFSLCPLHAIVNDVDIYDKDNKEYVILHVLYANDEKDYVCVVFDSGVMRLCTFNEILYFADRYRNRRPRAIATEEVNIEL